MLALCGGRVLTPDGWLDDAVVALDGERIAAVTDRVSPGADAVDITGRWVLPGLVDIHGDGFERCVAPRPATTVPIEMTLVEADRAVLAAGITSAFWSITDAFEPGLRSRDTLRRLLDVLSPPSPLLRANTHVHVRHEVTALDEHDELRSWLGGGRIRLFSVNDHARPEHAESYARNVGAKRAQTSVGWEAELVARARHRRDEGITQCDELCTVARDAGVVIASHDDDSPEVIDRSLARGATIVEFPATLDLFARARRGGAVTLMGAPNLVRGGSHTGFPSVAEAITADAVDCLCSDYHYLSLFHAPFVAADTGLLPFESAWALASTAPAAAAGLAERTGTIGLGLDADLLIVDPASRRLESVFVRGVEVGRWR